MDLEKKKNKFNFFKTESMRKNSSFSNLIDASNYTFMIIVIGIISGIVFKVDMKSQPIQEQQKVQEVLSVKLNSVDTQEKINLITQVENLKYTKLYDENKSVLLKEINKNLKVKITNFKNKYDSLEVRGYMLDNKKKIELSFGDEKISVKWIAVTHDEIETFAKTWKGDVQTEVRTNAGNTKETVLVANVSRAQANAIAPSNEIKTLEIKLEKLKEENFQLKKNNAEMIVKKAVKDNPQLKLQEKEIQKFVDSFLDINKGK